MTGHHPTPDEREIDTLDLLTSTESAQLKLLKWLLGVSLGGIGTFIVVAFLAGSWAERVEGTLSSNGQKLSGIEAIVKDDVLVRLRRNETMLGVVGASMDRAILRLDRMEARVFGNGGPHD